MNKVQRTKGIRRIIRTRVMNIPARKYVIAGCDSCSLMMYEARQRRIPGPSDSAILARAQVDLKREIRSGYWLRVA